MKVQCVLQFYSKIFLHITYSAGCTLQLLINSFGQKGWVSIAVIIEYILLLKS